MSSALQGDISGLPLLQPLSPLPPPAESLTAAVGLPVFKQMVVVGQKQECGNFYFSRERNKKVFVADHPVASEWDYEKNQERYEDGNLKGPEYYTQGSHFKAYWKCSKGHSFRALIFNRCSKQPTDCLKCKRPRRAFKNPLSEHLVAKEWDYGENQERDKDGNLKGPACYDQRSQKVVGWWCVQHHTWQARISSRCRKKKPTGCPECKKTSSLREISNQKSK
ncbi:MAG: hypothetical protein S4CHLAM45_15370 [Chlamydiales bacterium]|nr:hypothetical protein [Chlamydiales bacterium]MCH9620154.1 hypothetical protein [Chlamydiales bacterium]MCH9623624.1 hypothetical protein [Chlamydiales bacterium]